MRSASIPSSSNANDAQQPLTTVTDCLAPTELQLEIDSMHLGTLVQDDEPIEFVEQNPEPCEAMRYKSGPAQRFVEDCHPEESDSGKRHDMCLEQLNLENTRERFEPSITESNRIERSNSCSQAEASAAQLAAAAAAASAHSAGGIGASSLSHDNLAAAKSVSQQSIPTIVDTCLERSSTDQLVQNHDSSTNLDAVQGSHDCTEILPGACNNSSRIQNHAFSLASSSSRFFSSKLNTGSLWSLLSVGSNSSTNTNDMTNTDSLDQTTSTDHAESSDTVDHGQSKQQQRDNIQISNIFSRVQFKRVNSQIQQQVQQSTISKLVPEVNNHSLNETMANIRLDQSSNERKRIRFSVKYFGSSMLHKNFTLPMLEWIAKDIRRQTVKGAQIISQRQFTIPARDIFLEIQSYQITAISCRDGHCIYVHPMHCISKYAQLQHDPTCFAYLIRETKDSPLFCHVFQAKSANKVHDIFSAVREVTTRTQICHPTLPPTPTSSTNLQSVQPNQGASASQSASKVQKSASSDLKDVLCSIQNEVRQMPGPSKTFPSKQQETSSFKSLSSRTPTQVQHYSNREQANNQFENSYQFEVMLVKKVKVQRRRVPTTFVDDALETLKSFEVLKGGESKSQIKGVGKRIISASVDERQEYDETCQSPTPSGSKSAQMPQFVQQQSVIEVKPVSNLDVPRRGSSVSLHQADQTITEERESRSCQQSPTKVGNDTSQDNGADSFSRQDKDGNELKKHQSMDCLKSLNHKFDGELPTYSNDFSPYNTITSTDLNERIAAIPVVSSSVSLDHETRQKLARQVRETIMATAANIKKGVYASGDKLNCSASSKALDSLSCTVASNIPTDPEDQDLIENDKKVPPKEFKNPMSESQSNETNWANSSDHRRLSANPCPSFLPQTSNNFDLFRRASARQVVRNRTVLLLIGKDELCTISIDQHQLLFSKSFSSIVHCLQGNNNKDHFGLICRDSGKINPNAESYAGFIFKCQSEKVVREIMSALKQVIYSSQHNYHGYNSPYNPLNTIASTQYKPHQSPKLDRFQQNLSTSSSDSRVQHAQSTGGQLVSLAAKRGFTNPIEIDEASSTRHSTEVSTASPYGVLYQRTNPATSSSTPVASTTAPSQPKNLIKSMFCDDCPLYWYHRLCCDIESLPAEASKSIILRRIDSSMTDKEQDELYSRFSEFNIDSISEHNEIFMSLLRHLCEKKQFKHSQSSLHLSTMAKNTSEFKQHTSTTGSISRQLSAQGSGLLPTVSLISTSSPAKTTGGHQRSGSSSGSLAHVISQSSASQATHSITDAGSAAIDNFKKAKNSISSSIENMLKRRSSMRDDIQDEHESINLPSRAGSFRATSRESRFNVQNNDTSDQTSSNLKRSQSSGEYTNGNVGQSSAIIPSWKDSFSRTINDDLTNPLVGFFRRRNSGQGSKLEDSSGNMIVSKAENHISETTGHEMHTKQQGSPNLSESMRFMYPNQQTKEPTGGSSPSSMLSSVFWKKSIFDKIRQPIATEEKINDKADVALFNQQSGLNTNKNIDPTKLASVSESSLPKKRSKEELRLLWKKAIIEQITLIKMDRQNQRLLANKVECDIQRLKLNYRDVLYSKDVAALWDKLLKQDPTQKVEFAEVAKLVRKGVPKQRRGEIWMFLMNQYQLRHGTSFQPADSEFHGDANQTYRDLLSQLSTQQHEIFVDIGKLRTRLDDPSRCFRSGLLSASENDLSDEPRLSKSPFHHVSYN